jgi:hypothetical protein
MQQTTVSENPKKPDMSPSALGPILPLLVFAMGVTYIVTPTLYFNGIYCPENAIIDGMLGSIGFFVLCGGIFIFCSSCLAASVTPRPDGTLRLKLKFLSNLYMTNRNAFVSIMLCGMLLGVVEWWDNIHAYYCLTNDKAILRMSAFQPAKALDWDGVTLVTADCQVVKSRRSASIWLAFRSGDTIEVQLMASGLGLQRRYQDLREFLEHTQYSYKLGDSVASGRCPPEVYPLLTNWVYDKDWNSPSICRAPSIYCALGIGGQAPNGSGMFKPP